MTRLVNTLSHRIGPVAPGGTVLRIGPGVAYDPEELGVADQVADYPGQVPEGEYEAPVADEEPASGGTITTETGGTVGAAAGSEAEVEFASEAAEEKADELGVADQLESGAGSGKDGAYTVADIERIAP